MANNCPTILTNNYYTKYYGSFDDNVNHDRIDIYLKRMCIDEITIPEKLTLEANPLVISYSAKEFHDQLFGCGAKINIINDTGDFFHYDDIYSVPERNTYVEIIKTINYTGVGGLETLVYGQGPPGNPVPQGDSSIMLFQGYVLPEMYTQTFRKNNTITITATDQLSLLDRYTPIALIDTSSYHSDQYINAFDLISTILVDTDISNTIEIHSDMENVNYQKDPCTASTIFNNMFFNADQFADKNNLMTSKMDMEMMLKPFLARCYYSNGKWIIERTPDMGKPVKDFVTYVKDTSVHSYHYVDNQRVNLSNQDIIADTGTVTYNPGNIKLVTNLNYKLSPSLVENYFFDCEYYNNDVSTKSTKPIPSFRKWMMSDTDTSIYFEPFTDNNIVSGIAFGPAGSWGMNLDKYNYLASQFVSTMFNFTPNPTETKVSVKFNHSIIPNVTSAGQNVKVAFALRAMDASGNDWWIARSLENDTSTFWSPNPYLFTKTDTYESIRDNNFLFEVSEEVDITDPINNGEAIITARRLVRRATTLADIIIFWEDNRYSWETFTYTVPTTLQKIGNLFLDIYPMSRTSSGFPNTTWFSYWTQFGDVDLDIETEIPRTIMETELTETLTPCAPTYFTAIQNFQLDIFDTDSVQFTNGVYNMDSSSNYRTIWGWRDDQVDDYVPLANKYMESLANMYWKPRYALTLDVRSRDSSLFTLGNIYTHNDFVYPDGSTMEFICNGLDFNVKANAYRLNLLEYDQDNNWKAQDYPYFLALPSYLQFNYTGDPSQYIDISSNLVFTYDASSWINIHQDSSIRYSISCDVNGPADRRGYINFYMPQLDTARVYVDQFSSATNYIEFDNAGNIDFTGLNGVAVDVSVLISATATVTSFFGDSLSTDSRTSQLVDGDSGDGVSATVTTTSYATQTNTAYSNYVNATDISTVEVDIQLGPWSNNTYSIQSPSGFAQITNCKLHGTSTDVSVRYNRWDSYFTETGLSGGGRSYV